MSKCQWWNIFCKFGKSYALISENKKAKKEAKKTKKEK